MFAGLKSKSLLLKDHLGAFETTSLLSDTEILKGTCDIGIRPSSGGIKNPCTSLCCIGSSGSSGLGSLVFRLVNLVVSHFSNSKVRL